jgi:hypothetical protein
MTALAAPVAPRKRQTVALRKRARFLELIRDGYSVRKACEELKIPRRTLYDHRNADPDFAQDWDDAWEQGADLLEDLALSMAASGSELMTIFLLKGRRPQRYRDNVRHEVDARLTVTVEDARAELVSRFEQIASHRQAAIDGKSKQLEPAAQPTDVA